MNSEHKVVTETAQAMSGRPQLRQQLRKKRQDIASGQKTVWDEAIGQKLMAWYQQNRPASLGVYWPIQAEPDLRPCYRQLQQAGCQLALPLVTAKDCPLSFLEWLADDDMTLDSYGIAIPAHGRTITLPPVLLIPCLGWSTAGYRLGYGGGYYDRTLERQPRPLAIGIAYNCTQVEFVAQAHDIAMDLIISA